MGKQVKNRINKLFSVFISLVMVIQSLLPGFYFAANPGRVLAQEATSTAETVAPTASPTAEPTSSPEVSPEPSISPLADPTPTPSEEPSPTPSPVTEVSPAPSEELTPNVSPNPPPAESANLESPSPSPSESLTPEPSATPTIETEQPTIQGHISATILENTNAQSLELDLTTQDVSSASLSTDKADYAPTDTAVISGSDFPKEANLKLIITADNYRFETNLKTDENGSFAYFYQLDGTYRPLYNKGRSTR